MKKIVIDATTVLATQGYTSGIPRVVFSFLQVYYSIRSLRECTVFIAHNNLADRFDEIAHGRIVEKLEQLGYPADAAEEPSGRAGGRVGALEEHFAGADEYVFLSLGAYWHEEGLCKQLYSLKQKVNLRCGFIFYDFIPVFLPQTFGPGFPEQFVRSTVNALWATDVGVCISEHTRRDLFRLCEENHIPRPEARVIRLGDDLPVSSQTTEERPEGIPSELSDSDFILCVGTLEVRKNQVLLYQVWRRLALRLPAEKLPRLVIVGREGWLASMFKYPMRADPLVRGSVSILESCSDEDLEWLYSNCSFFLYPSIYEGWGLPVSEGLAHGKYGIVSNSSSVPEVGGDLLDYHDPLDPLDLEEKLWRAWSDRDFLASKEKEIAENYRVVEWSESAKLILDAFGSDLLGVQ